VLIDLAYELTPKPADLFHNRIAWRPSARLSSGLAIKCLWRP